MIRKLRSKFLDSLTREEADFIRPFFREKPFKKGETLLIDGKECCQIVSKMLCCDLPEVTQDVIDGVGELTNIVGGGFKTKYQVDAAHQLELSIPAVILSKDPVHIAKLKKSEDLKLFVDCGGIHFDVYFSYSVSEKKEPVQKKDDASANAAFKNLQNFLHPGAGQ